MRITAGNLRGRVLPPLKGREVRPTSSMVREALFNILGNIEGMVLDLYAGTGSVGFEAISRGAASAIFIDISGDLLHAIRTTASKWGILRKIHCIKADALKFTLKHPEEKFDLIYADPPFTKEYPDLRFVLPLLSENGSAVFEMPTRNMPEWSKEAKKIRTYGESSLAVF